MRKQKIIKMTASPLDPSLGGSFQPPATHNGDISIVFRGKDMSIHGWDGSAWSTIYTRNGNDKQFTFPHTYENYYVKSLTGSDETFSASFFSTGKYERSTPLLAGVQRDTKLHDIEEVPVYTASDANKLLTIMSDGSLRWLGINESYIVEVIGTGEETPTEPVAPSLLSQSTAFGDASYNASTDVMTFDGTGDYATFAGDWKYTDVITFGAWFKTTATGDRRIMSSHVRSGSPVRNGFLLYLNNGRLDFFEPSFSAGNFTHAGPTGMNDGQWHHVALAWDANSNWVLYVDGQQYSTNSNGAQAPAYMDGWDLYIGANGWNGNNPYGFFDGQIGGAFVENEAMTLEQIQAIYDNGPEYVASTEAPVVTAGNISGLEEHADLTLHGNAQLIDGVLHVDGTNGTYLSIPHALDYDRENGDLSINMWFKANSLPNNWNAALVSKMGSGWDGYITGISTMAADDGSGNMTSGGLQTTTWSGGNNPSPNNRAAPSGGISLDTWYHVAYVMPATGDYKMYFNGVEIHSYVPTARNTSTTGDLRIGGWGPVNGYAGWFDGMIDGVFVEKKVLTAQEVSDIHAAGRGSSEPAPAVSYVEDRSDLTLGAGTTIDNGIVNIGYDYSASLQVGGAGSAGPFRSLFETYAYSVSFFVKTTNTADMVFVADHWRGTSNGFFVQYGANGVFYFIKANGTGAVTSPNSTQVLRDGSWHHVTLTVSPGGAQKLYIDGNQFCSVNVGGDAPFDANSTLSFGWLEKGPHAQDTGRPVGGQMDQIQIHDSTLTAQEVSDLHAAGRGSSEPTQTYLEETATLYGDANVSGGTLVLDGNGDYAVIDDDFRFTDVLSTSIWFKTTATGDRRIYSSHVRGMSGDDFKNGFFARLNNGQLKYRHPSGGTAELTGPSGLNDGQWHHMAVTWENNVGYTLYVDGSQVATGGAGASDGYASGWGLYIGANPWLNNNPYGFFSGEVSKFEVLNEVLTAQDVTDRYNAGV